MVWIKFFFEIDFKNFVILVGNGLISLWKRFFLGNLYLNYSFLKITEVICMVGRNFCLGGFLNSLYFCVFIDLRYSVCGQFITYGLKDRRKVDLEIYYFIS